jgi:hypothetical protein
LIQLAVPNGCVRLVKFLLDVTVLIAYNTAN